MSQNLIIPMIQTLTGSDDNDRLFGSDDNDRIIGNAGNDSYSNGERSSLNVRLGIACACSAHTRSHSDFSSPLPTGDIDEYRLVL
ncbi:MAG: hypothetical protein GDA48_24700 [Hormoscilla sp. GM102CHS1]|nr:hypothetical protein [Hormoscilla sp. GM102CHS1]